MGKWKRRKFGARYDPARSNGAENKTEEDVNEIEPLSIDIEPKSTGGLKAAEEHIKSSAIEDRIFGLNSLAALALESGAPEIIAKSNVLAAVIPMLDHENIQVRLTAVGAMRNICAGGSDEVVAAVVDSNNLDPLSNLILESNAKCTKPIDETDSLATRPTFDISENPDVLWNPILIHSVVLMWNLCECCDAAVETFNDKKLLQVLIDHIEPCWGESLAMACADCLLCVSENNDGLETMKHTINTKIKHLIAEYSSSPSNYKYIITLTGILANLNNSNDDIAIILESICKVLDFKDYIATKFLPHNTNNNHLENILSAQQLAFEIFCNCCCVDDSDDDSFNSASWENCSNKSEMDAEEMEVEDDQDHSNLFSIPLEVEECIKKFDLASKTLSKINFVDEELSKFFSEHKGSDVIITKAQTLQIRALVCLQNLVSCLDVESLGGADMLHKIWITIGNLLVDVDKSNMELIESATGALRAIIAKLVSTDNLSCMENVSIKDVQILFNVGETCDVPHVRANLARIVGTLGCLYVKLRTADQLAKINEPSGLFVSEVTTSLINLAQQDKNLWVVAEALDNLIDIYSDDKTDKLAHCINLIDRMKVVKQLFMTRIRVEGRENKEHNALISTVKDNIPPFLKYKQTRVSKVSHKKNKV